jgi:hypothetical protein
VEEERGTTGSSGLAGSVLVERKDLESAGGYYLKLFYLKIY